MKRVLSLFLAAVLLFSLFPSAMAAGIYTPGTYTSTAKGIASNVKVTMTFSETSIKDVKIDTSGETPELGGMAGPKMEKDIILAQSFDIDGVSSATITSAAIKEAAAECINQAKTTDGAVSGNIYTAIYQVHSAEEKIVSVSTLQIGEWYADGSSLMLKYFDDLFFIEHYDSKSSYSFDKKAKEMYDYRVSAKEKLDKAKEIIRSIDNKDDLYDAVKDYYKVVNKFYALVSTFPEGYSKLTFMQAVADCKAECQDAYAEVDFNM